ncbi:AaceriAEL108Wp [[Ashbya] aceris (nom. inval.)]|nr:AaceriAEL108Wp [[Ashbya] aceris (nom. inval.)]
MAKTQTLNVAKNSQAASVAKLVAESPTLSHLQRYGAADALARWLPWTLVSALASVVVAVLATAKQYLVDAPGTPAAVKAAWLRLLAGAQALDSAVSTLVLRDGVDAFREQYVQHGAVGLWAAYFALDFTANVSNYVLRGLVRPLRVAYEPRREEAASPTSSAGSEMPHLRELTNTTNALRRDISTKYIEPTRTMIESYLEPTRNKIEAEYIHPINERVESTKTLLNSTYDAAYETVSRTYEGNLSSHESVSRALVSTGVDLGSKTLEKIRAVTRSADGQPTETVNGAGTNGNHKTNGVSHAANGIRRAGIKAHANGNGKAAAGDENAA